LARFPAGPRIGWLSPATQPMAEPGLQERSFVL